MALPPSTSPKVTRNNEGSHREDYGVTIMRIIEEEEMNLETVLHFNVPDLEVAGSLIGDVVIECWS